jgi:hypothetical protein
MIHKKEVLNIKFQLNLDICLETLCRFQKKKIKFQIFLHQIAKIWAKKKKQMLKSCGTKTKALPKILDLKRT